MGSTPALDSRRSNRFASKPAAVAVSLPAKPQAIKADSPLIGSSLDRRSHQREHLATTVSCTVR